MPDTTFLVDACLFDMDGTLVDSTAGVIGAWHKFKETYHGIDVHEILNTAHGIRTVDNLRNFCGITDPEELEREALRFEQAIVETSTLDGRKGIARLPGVPEIMDKLIAAEPEQTHHWAICTSATRTYARQALNIAGVPAPEVFVAAEDVSKGKPFPDPYLLGAEKCGVAPERCLVIEDAPSGIRSGRAAGCKTLGVVTTHTREQLEAAQADFITENLSKVSIQITKSGIEVTIHGN